MAPVIGLLLSSYLVMASSVPEYQSEGGFKKIICPFLSTLVNEGVFGPDSGQRNRGCLPVQQSYTFGDLFKYSVLAGVDRKIAHDHSKVNFASFDLASMKDGSGGHMDIFSMEGYPNEHVASTGINDCHTDFGHCTRKQGPDSCPQRHTDQCQTPNPDKFETFWSLISTDGETATNETVVEVMKDRQALESNGLIVDENPIGENPCHVPIGASSCSDSAPNYGVIAGYDLLVNIFGETTKRISKEAMRSVVIDRRFPSHYTYPSCDATSAQISTSIVV